MHSVEVNIRICQPEKVMFPGALQSPGEHHLLGLSKSYVTLNRMHQLYKVTGKEYFVVDLCMYSYAYKLSTSSNKYHISVSLPLCVCVLL